ncbi:MAG TPA: response regulator transcription factor [Candidatus Angelobacter sp.]|nr:response regulator transcription factor [Candidatus Angelobacter sp.]
MTPGHGVLLVEDHELLAEMLCTALVAEGVAARTVPPTATADVLRAVESDAPAVVLLDLDLGEAVGDGTALIGPIASAGSSVLLVTGSTDRLRIAAAVAAGAVGYVLKSGPFDELLAAVRDVLAGVPVLTEAERFELLALRRRASAAEAARRHPFDRLTPREQQVLRALTEGHSVDAIADRWVVSPATVRTQVRGILTKLGVGTQLAAVALARRSGWPEATEQHES